VAYNDAENQRHHDAKGKDDGKDQGVLSAMPGLRVAVLGSGKIPAGQLPTGTPNAEHLDAWIPQSSADRQMAEVQQPLNQSQALALVPIEKAGGATPGFSAQR